MQKFIFTTCLILAVSSVKSQTIRPETIHEFTSNISYYYRYGNFSFKSVINEFFTNKGYTSQADISVIMETVESDKKSRDLVFEAIFECSKKHGFGNDLYDSIFNTLYSIDMSAVHAKELAGYIFFKYAKEGVDYDTVK